jgi:hypothetical protein
MFNPPFQFYKLLIEWIKNIERTPKKNVPFGRTNQNGLTLKVLF